MSERKVKKLIAGMCLFAAVALLAILPRQVSLTGRIWSVITVVALAGLVAYLLAPYGAGRLRWTELQADGRRRPCSTRFGLKAPVVPELAEDRPGLLHERVTRRLRGRDGYRSTARIIWNCVNDNDSTP